MAHRDESDRRHQGRLALNAEALIRLILPEETLSPRSFRGVATDISPEGMKVRTYQVERDQFLHLRRHTTLLCDVTIELPYLHDPLQMRGVVAWMHYEEGNRKEGDHVVIGVRLDLSATDGTRRLHYVLNRVEGDAYMTPTPSTERVKKI